MRRNYVIVGVLLVCIACVLGSARRCSEELLKANRKVDPKLVALHTFNNLASFKVNDANPRSFSFVTNSVSNEAYLRFRIEDFNPSDYDLTMSIRANASVLKGACVRSAQNVISSNRGDIKGDVATYVVDMSDSDTFMWSDKACYVGICIPKFLLKSGDTVELLDFKFSLR